MEVASMRADCSSTVDASEICPDVDLRSLARYPCRHECESYIEEPVGRCITDLMIVKKCRGIVQVLTGRVERYGQAEVVGGISVDFSRDLTRRRQEKSSQFHAPSGLPSFLILLYSCLPLCSRSPVLLGQRRTPNLRIN